MVYHFIYMVMNIHNDLQQKGVQRVQGNNSPLYLGKQKAKKGKKEGDALPPWSSEKVALELQQQEIDFCAESLTSN